MNGAIPDLKDPEPNYLNGLVYIPNTPEITSEFKDVGIIVFLTMQRHSGTNVHIYRYIRTIRLAPNETNFLNKLPMQVTFGQSPLINVEIITYETISKALFETRLQIHEYEKVPRNVLGARINFSQMPYTQRP